MRICLFFLLLPGFNIQAQPKYLTGNTVSGFIDQLPGLAANAHEAYDLCFPRDKKTIFHQCEEDLKGLINVLAERSNHQSRLLSMLSGKYDQESEQYDFSKVKVARDKTVEQKFNDFNTAFFYEVDNYLRGVNEMLDVLSKENITGMAYAEKMLTIYREKNPVFLKKVKKLLTALDDMLDKTGYNTILSAGNSGHPYYIQLLELRGTMLDRVLLLHRQTAGANKAAAEMVDACRKNPEACK